MFSQACIIPSVHAGGVCIRGVADTPQNTMGYGQRAGGTHPTGMHSCKSGQPVLWKNVSRRLIIFDIMSNTRFFSGSSKYAGSSQLDPENHLLEVNHWHDDSKGYPSQYTTSAKHCYPVSESYYYSLRGPQARKFLSILNIKPGWIVCFSVDLLITIVCWIHWFVNICNVQGNLPIFFQNFSLKKKVAIQECGVAINGNIWHQLSEYFT